LEGLKPVDIVELDVVRVVFASRTFVGTLKKKGLRGKCAAKRDGFNTELIEWRVSFM